VRPLDPRLLPHLTPARWPLAGVVAGSVASGVLLIAQAFAVAGLLVGLYEGATAGSWSAARTAGGVLAVVVVARAVASFVVDTCAARASRTVTTTLRRRLLEAALALGPFALTRRRSGELATLATRGVAAVDPYLTRYLPALVVAAVLPALTVLAIAGQDLLSAVIVVATLPLVPVFAVLVGLATRDRADRQWRALSTLAGHFVDVVRGLPTLVAYRRADAQSRSIREVTDRYRRATNETLKLAFASSAVLELVATISVALVAVTVGLRLSGGSLDLGTALVVLLLAPEAYWPLRRVGAEFHAAAEGTATFEAVDEILTTAPADTATGQALGFHRLLQLDGVSVTYPGCPNPVLTDVSASISPHGLTAVVGPSGSGKSTLLAALMGHLPLADGTITVDGVPVDADPDAWRSLIAWVPQRPWIAAGTIADNVRLARPDATDADVWLALERVGLGELVASLPRGLDEVLGEDGAGLSAGERARLALARAVVAQRPLVLLDEPTAHLDAATEDTIAATITWLAARSAVVVVAHRERLVELADQVVAIPAPVRTESGASTPPAATEAHVRSEPEAGQRPRAVASVEGDESGSRKRSTGSQPRHPGRRDTARLAGGMALGAGAAASGVALTATAGWLIARAAEHPPVLMLMVAIVGVRTFGLARPVLRYAERLVSHDVALRLLAERRASVYDAVVPLVPGRLGRHRGDLLASLVEDVDSLVDRHLRVRAPLVTYVTVSALATGFATWVLPVAGLVTGVVLALGGGLAYATSRLGTARAERDHVAARGRLGERVVHTLSGAADLVMWQATGRALDTVDSAGDELGGALSRAQRAVASGRAAAVAVSGLGMLAMAASTASPHAAGDVSGPMVALLVLLPLALLEITAPLSDTGALAVRVRAADHRLAGLAATPPAVSDPVPARPLPQGPPTLVADAVAAGWDTEAFSGLDLDLPPGRRVAVVGPSGSGKSTLAAVLLRFIDPRRGTVALSDVCTDELALEDVRRTVGLVDDDPHIFGSTLRENIRLARPGADDDAIVAALVAARLGTWFDTLPEGLDTMLGDGHAQVSGGERARIGLARALLADLPVLVLDEPTAHLDAGTAEAVAADLLGGTSDRTVVWITHGTAGLDQVDEVLDLARLGDPAPLPELRG
jgi:ATP-binding cassette subfamily C protein CydCD